MTKWWNVNRRLERDVRRIKTATLFLAVLVLLISLVQGCGCLAAQSYDQPACQSYHTDWPHHYFDED